MDPQSCWKIKESIGENDDFSIIFLRWKDCNHYGFGAISNKATPWKASHLPFFQGQVVVFFGVAYAQGSFGTWNGISIEALAKLWYQIG